MRGDARTSDPWRVCRARHLGNGSLAMALLQSDRMADELIEIWTTPYSMSWAAPRSSFLLPCWFTRYSRRFATAENDRTCEVHGAVLSVLKAPVLIRWADVLICQRLTSSLPPFRRIRELPLVSRLGSYKMNRVFLGVFFCLGFWLLLGAFTVLLFTR